MIRHTLAPLLAMALASAAPPANPADGTWTNEEDRYFTGERGAAAPEWLGLEIADGRWRPVDAYGAGLDEWRALPVPGVSQDAEGRWWMARSGGGRTELRRGVPFSCWLAIPRFAKNADGSDDTLFAARLRTHDQGGRVTLGGGTSGAPQAIFRLRNVVWPKPSTNRPSLVLYVIKPENPDKAVSYTWADPDADLIGINLRWVQGSCTRASAAAQPAR